MFLPQPWLIIAIISSTLLHIGSQVAKSFPEADKVKSLPDQPPVGFQQFAGYVAVDDNQQRALFYYLFESQTSPDSKPLVLWLNGGPGCSSVGFGAFTEHGPFITNYGEAIVKNHYSWNKEANILYLDSPAGVGFSYSVNNSFYPTLNDEITGHFVPQLAELIVKSEMNFNLKGIAMGNPLLDLDTDANAVDEYYWSHGMISDSTYKIRTSLCNSSRLNREFIGGQLSPNCISAVHQVFEEYSFVLSIDPYYIIGDKCLSYNLSQANFLRELLHSGLSQFLKPLNKKQTYELDQQLDECNEKYAEMYLNREDVQKALHARLLSNTSYHLCSKFVQRNYKTSDSEIPTIDAVGFLVKSGIRVIIYSGDQDAVVPFIGTRRLVDGLAKKVGLKTTVPYRAWSVDKQVGGWTQVYGDKLTYATIRGASHGPPTTQPRRSFVLFNAFLHGKSLPKA